ncbi:MAG TPA: D-lactate dehydrogenase [Xanthomonadales bacterium]|nr:D-lactate dehydrogenase [Xanthomonadales bacterium]
MNEKRFTEGLRSIVGRRNVLTNQILMAPYCRGFRFGDGTALAVVRPGSLVELWEALQLCVKSGVAIIMQAANTGLTGGSTPLSSYDRAVVVISTLRIDGIFLIRGNDQAVCLAGSTLQNFEEMLDDVGREPHSVLGSSCIGASIVGGVCNNSGGALVNRGPAYTELSLFARVTSSGELEMVNQLGIELGDSPEEMLRRLEKGDFSEDMIGADDKLASDTEYERRVRDVEADDPARYNADPRRLHEASGCSGKLAVFAVRLDTFPAPRQENTFFLSTNSPAHLTQLRRQILSELKTLPVLAEYIHRETLQLTVDYGRDTVWFIDKLGTRRIPFLFRTRSRVEAFLGRLFRGSDHWAERMLQMLSRVLPVGLPSSASEAMDRFEHHMILKARDEGIAEIEALLNRMQDHDDFQFFRCSKRDAHLISLYRFAAAGAANRYAACHHGDVDGIVALDIALPRNEQEWLEQLPESLNDKLVMKLYFGHFLCHVLHQDYIVRADEKCEEVKQALLELTRQRGARYPAEHNHGHVYDAPDHVRSFYKTADPTNTLNPGVGRMSTRRNYE